MVVEQDVKAYYNQHHRAKGEQSWRPREAFSYFLDLIGVQVGQSLLEVGFGTGYLVEAGSDHRLQVSGQEISEEAFGLASEMVPNVNFLYWKFTEDKGAEQRGINECLYLLKQWKEFFTRGGVEIESTYQDKDWFIRKVKVFESPNPFQWLLGWFHKLKWQILPPRFACHFIFLIKKSAA